MTAGFIERGHRGTQQFFSLPAPIIAALKGERVRVKVARAKIESRTKKGEDS